MYKPVTEKLENRKEMAIPENKSTSKPIEESMMKPLEILDKNINP